MSEQGQKTLNCPCCGAEVEVRDGAPVKFCTECGNKLDFRPADLYGGDDDLSGAMSYDEVMADVQRRSRFFGASGTKGWIIRAVVVLLAMPAVQLIGVHLLGDVFAVLLVIIPYFMALYVPVWLAMGFPMNESGDPKKENVRVFFLALGLYAVEIALLAIAHSLM